MTLADADEIRADQCYRCGYDLRGIGDDQPCSECGLLAGRSRRPTDELHHTRPGWLWRLSWGVRLILLALLLAAIWPFVADRLAWRAFTLFGNAPGLGYVAVYHGVWLGADLAALLLLAGVLLLTSREGYPPADRADAWRRRLLRLGLLAPVSALVVGHVVAQMTVIARRAGQWYGTSDDWYMTAIFLLLTLGCIPLPILLFFQLRSLAKRARSAHLAEHCAIVGIGNALTLLYVPLFALIMANAERWGFGFYWTGRSHAALVLMIVLAVSALLFALWNVYLLVRFSIAFSRAARKLRSQWKRDDRSVALA